MGVVVAASFRSRAGASPAVAPGLLARDGAQTTREAGSEPDHTPVCPAEAPEGRRPTLDVRAADARLRIAPEESGHPTFAAFVTLSLFAHLALYAGLNSWSPPPMSASGEEVITVEIVVGSNSAAGLAETPVPNEEENPVAGQVAKTEVPKEQPTTEVEPPKPAEPPPETAATEPPKPVEPPAESVARVEPKPDEEIAPTVRPDEPVVAPAKPETPAVPSSGIGHGRSAPNARYFGEIASHLARRKQYPLDARRRRQQGAGVVKFTIGPAGQVSAIELVRGTGFAALDREIEAMVRRAAPFPPPPGGVSVSFAAPVSFRIN